MPGLAPVGRGAWLEGGTTSKGCATRTSRLAFCFSPCSLKSVGFGSRAEKQKGLKITDFQAFCGWSSWGLKVLTFENENLGEISWNLDSMKQDLEATRKVQNDLVFADLEGMEA